MSTCAPPMLPVTFQFLIAMIAHAINERMARRLDCVQEEVRPIRPLRGTGATLEGRALARIAAVALFSDAPTFARSPPSLGLGNNLVPKTRVILRCIPK